MGFFGSDESSAYDQVQSGENKSSWSHELIAGAAAFEAEKQYEKHVAANGAPPSHQMAKELLAGFAGAEADKLIETKGLDFLDKEKAKHQAKQLAEQSVTEDNYQQYN